MTKRRYVDVDENGFYWYFVVAWWIPIDRNDLLRTEVAVTAGAGEQSGTPTAAERSTARSAAGLWLALLAGPLAASLQLSLNYALVKWACANGGE